MVCLGQCFHVGQNPFCLLKRGSIGKHIGDIEDGDREVSGPQEPADFRQSLTAPIAYNALDPSLFPKRLYPFKMRLRPQPEASVSGIRFKLRETIANVFHKGDGLMPFGSRE